ALRGTVAADYEGPSRSDGSTHHRLTPVARRIRFSTQSGSQPTGQDWLARAKRLEAIGYETLSMPDHMVGGAWSNMPALGAAAAGHDEAPSRQPRARQRFPQPRGPRARVRDPRRHLERSRRDRARRRMVRPRL